MSQPTTRFESADVSPTPLGEPLHFEFSGLTAQNRFMKAAMSEMLSSWDPKNLEARGIPSQELVNVYKRWGEGQYGVILSGNVMIEYDQLEAPGNLIVPPEAPFSGERFQQFQKLATAAKAHGSLFVGQVSHPGRQTSEALQKDPVSASAVQLEGEHVGTTFAKPHAASEAEIQRVIAGFAHAAEFLHRAGFDGIQLHAAHGYLLAQFLSPTTNRRTDRYGGSLENRQRLILEIAAAVRARVPDSFSVSIKVNSVEFQDGGFSPDDCAALCAALERAGLDFVELSGGTYESLAFHHKRESTRRREAFFLEFAEKIVPQLKKTRTYVVGGMRTVAGMVRALDTVHGVSVARPAAQEPGLAADLLAGKFKGVIDQKLDAENFPLTNVAAGTMIRQVGKGEAPIDLSIQDNVDRFTKSMAKWTEDKAQDKEGVRFGYVDLLA